MRYTTARIREIRREAPTIEALRALRPMSFRRRMRSFVKKALYSAMKKSERIRRLSRKGLNAHRGRLYGEHMAQTEVNPKVVLFETFMGRSYACSPRAIYEEMCGNPRFADYTFIWAFKNVLRREYDQALDRAVIVRYGSAEYYRALAEAKVWITNSRIADHVTRRPEQLYVQCWHGTPFKRLGGDIKIETQNAMHSTDELGERYRQDAVRYSYMVSPSRFTSDRLRSAFSLDRLFDHDIMLELGYPRNDRLSEVNPEQIDQLRAEYSIPQGKRVLLYAPTWRDNQHVAGQGYVYSNPVDFDKLQASLGDDWVILFRAHYFVSNEFDFERYAGFVIDVSAVDDINYLYIMSDVLVTDYSSVFFDYANLGRPILFYMYDLQEYANNLRGFYLDLDELPGPVIDNEDALISAMESLESYKDKYGARYAEFQNKFTPLDDGHAASRVVDAVWPIDTDSDQ